MKKFTAIAFILVLLFLAPAIQSSDQNITPAFSKEIIRQLREKYIPMYKNYKGIQSNRHVVIKTYDSKTDQLLHTSKVHVIRKDYFYEEPVVKVLKYIVDGEAKDPSTYKPLKYKPGYQVFDENGDKNYDTEVIGYKTVAEHHCYEVNVNPKKATKLHYQGKLYYRVADLNFVHSSGTMAELSFPVKELNMDLYSDALNDLSMISSGVITAIVDIPIIMPDRRIVSRFNVLNSNPIF